tara:strand:+ start:294 stop:1148 length:855 start_codon:yes stop_codon:yes gene_type:complete
MKLFWNCHLYNDSFWGEYHYKNSKAWVDYIFGSINFEEVKDINQVKSDERLIIVDSEIFKKKLFYEKLLEKNKKIYLLHLGDEGGKVNKNFYSNFIHVFRTFYFNSFANNPRITFIPIGYKTGPVKNLINLNERKYIWNFLGTIHGASRYDLMFQNKNIKPNYINITKKFGGQNSLGPKEYYEVMGDTTFSLVSHGYYHPETYRLYESLESGCIPIIENPHNFFDTFLPKNPIIKINLWKESREIIEDLNSNDKKKLDLCNSIQEWWLNYKLSLKSEIKKILNV